jgi:peptidoglycan/LPS O-acetylase OafA/YrhL
MMWGAWHLLAWAHSGHTRSWGAKSSVSETRSAGLPRRGDIQGLRALAVTSVVFYHAGLPGLSGGFVGVDLFFVISGFLITSLLLAEFDASARISLAGFWARRARRILPASTLVLVVTAVAVAIVVPALQRPAVSRDMLWAGLFSANWRFAYESTDYLAQSRATSPVLHYWSLGVEEQFYLGWPLLVFALVIVARRMSANPRLLLGAATTAIVVASFVYCLHETAANQPYAFFGTGSRAWQLGIGCILAIGQPYLARIGPAAAHLMAGAGILGLGWAFLTLQEAGGSHPYPGWSSLVPTLAAALLIAAGIQTRQTIVGHALSVRPLQLIGDLSYSWYLWHFPILVLGAIRYGSDSTLVTWLLVGLSFAAAWVSFTFVESPVRRLPALVRRSRHSLALGAALVGTALVSAAALPQLGTPPATTVVALDGHRVQLRPTPEEAPLDFIGMRGPGCDLDYEQVDMPECAFADETSNKNVVLLGDSHAVVMFPPLEAAAESRGWRLNHWSKSSCPVSDVTSYNTQRRRAFTECDEFRDMIIQRVLNRKPDLVVIASAYARRQQVVDRTTDEVLGPTETRPVVAEGLRIIVERLIAAGIPVLLVVDNPASPFDPPTCLAEKARVRPCTFARPSIAGPEHLVAEEVDKVRLLDFTDEICGQRRCSPVKGSILVYRDSNHLTKTFALTLTPSFSKVLSELSGNPAQAAPR